MGFPHLGNVFKLPSLTKHLPVVNIHNNEMLRGTTAREIFSLKFKEFSGK
jgi:hypothetical protein